MNEITKEEIDNCFSEYGNWYDTAYHLEINPNKLRELLYKLLVK